MTLAEQFWMRLTAEGAEVPMPICVVLAEWASERRQYTVNARGRVVNCTEQDIACSAVPADRLLIVGNDRDGYFPTPHAATLMKDWVWQINETLRVGAPRPPFREYVFAAVHDPATRAWANVGDPS